MKHCNKTTGDLMRKIRRKINKNKKQVKTQQKENKAPELGNSLKYKTLSKKQVEDLYKG